MNERQGIHIMAKRMSAPTLRWPLRGKGFEMWLYVVGCVSFIACSKDLTQLPVEYRKSEYWALRVNYPAVQLSTVSPYDTVRLTTTPYGADGTPLTSKEVSDSVLFLSPTTWRSTDPEYVIVDETGLVRARKNTGTRPVYIIATRQINWVTHVDTTKVAADNLENPPIFSTFRFSPDSLKRAAGTSNILPLTVIDTAGNTVSTSTLPLRFSVRRQDENVPEISFKNPWTNTITIILDAVREQRTMVLVRTWAYGRSYADSFQLEVGWPIAATGGLIYWQAVEGGPPKRNFVINDLDLGPGAQVQWLNNTGLGVRQAEILGMEAGMGDSMAVIFEDPTNVLASLDPSRNTGGGNIIPLPSDSIRSTLPRTRFRRFVKAGVYNYTIQPFGVRGRITIHEK